MSIILHILPIIFFALMTYALAFLALDMYKDISNPYKFEKTLVPIILMVIIVMVGIFFFLSTGFWLLEFLKVISV